MASLAVASCSAAPHRLEPQAAQDLPPVETVARYAEEEAPAALLRSIGNRLEAMQAVAAAKWMSGEPVLDPEREAAVLAAVQQRASTLGLDPDTTAALFQHEINVARGMQVRFHEHWRREQRCEPCALPASLAEVRARIDAATTSQLESLYIALPREMAGEAQARLQQGVASLAAQYRLTDPERDALRDALLDVQRSGRPSGLARVNATGVLRIGTTGDYAPFTLESGGVLEGADVELAVALAQELHARPVFVHTSWPSLAEDLRRDRFDVAVSGISDTAARAAVGYFSAPYHLGGKTIVARCADRARYGSVEKVDRPGVRVVANPGGTNEQFARAHVHAATLIIHGDNRTIFDELLSRRADVMFTDDVEADLQALRHPGELCRAYQGTLTNGAKRIYMARDDALRAAVDAWLAHAIAAGLPARSLERAMLRFGAPASATTAR
jgi:cyclohexadienyl dehydratase